MMSSDREHRLWHEFARNMETTENNENRFIDTVCYVLSMLVVICTFPFSMFVCLAVVKEFQRAVIFRMGRLRKRAVRGPGVIFLLPCIDNWIRVDLRTVALYVPVQEITTKDSYKIKVDAIVYYRIHDPLKAVMQIANTCESIKLLTQKILEIITGTRKLEELLAQIATHSHMIERILNKAADPWGVEIERVEIKDVNLPKELQIAMIEEAEIFQKARANIDAAEAELYAFNALREATDVSDRNPIFMDIQKLAPKYQLKG